MCLAQDNDVVHTFTPNGSAQPFDSILPGRGRSGRFVPDAHGAQSVCDDSTVDAITVPDDVARSLIPGECLGDLSRDPISGRICCDVGPDKISATEPDDDESIEQVKTDGRNNEQIHRGNVQRVIMQEAPPSLAGQTSPFDHVLGDARLCDLPSSPREFHPEALTEPYVTVSRHTARATH